MTRLLSLINGVQRRSFNILFIGQSHAKKRKRRKKKRDDCMMMLVQLSERKDRAKKKRWGDRCQVNDLEYILSERKRAY